jgi:hypothetical protein
MPPTAHVDRVKECAKAPVEVVVGSESATFSLAKCDGDVLPSAVDELSVLARPAGVLKVTQPADVPGKARAVDAASDAQRLDRRLIERLQLVADHFAKEGQKARIVVVSGYRPPKSGSYHSAGRALDFRVEGVKDEALVSFCKTLTDTGCGYYPNGAFVHMDVRDRGAGHVAWVDRSLRGERPGDLAPVAPSAVLAPVAPPAALASNQTATSPTPAGLGLSLVRPVDDEPTAQAVSPKLPPLPTASSQGSSPKKRRHRHRHVQRSL